MQKRFARLLFFGMTVLVILSCTGLTYYFVGVEHETEHLKNMLISVVIVLLFLMLVAEPIKYILMAIDEATWPPPPKYRKYQRESDEKYNRLDFLQQRLRGLRIQVIINERYRIPSINEEYKLIAQDLFLYGKYFVVLFCILLVNRDQLLFYNTNMLQKLLKTKQGEFLGLVENVLHLNQLLDFVKSSLVVAFDYDEEDKGVNYWVHSEPTKMLGVVRLRQLRLTKEQFGWSAPEFSSVKYMPNWELPYRQLHYADKYWRIYDPWVPIDDRYDIVDAILMKFDHIGFFQNYPELRGYVTLLARNKDNSMKILDFLLEYNWLNYNTSAVFLDFTLYNADANIFSVCTLRVENTPFGTTIPNVDCDSVKLIEELEQHEYIGLIVLVIYISVVLQFAQSLIITLWYEPTKIKSFWNKMDVVILVLNGVVIGLIVWRASLVHSILKRMEGANKLEFLNFRAPTRLHAFTTILIGFLICLTTLRLWRVLQFSKVFRIFTETFAMAWKALAITVAMILIILMAFGIAFATINGNNSVHYVRLLTSITTTLCFSFGFSNQLNYKEVLYGGFYLGIVLYALMGFVLTILLMNMFITTIADYFSTARKARDKLSQRRITFFEFLRVEYYSFFAFFQRLPCFRKQYKRNNRTVAQNIALKLDFRARSKTMKSRFKRERMLASIEKPKDEGALQAEYRERIERVLAVSYLLNTQLEILNLLFISRKPAWKERPDNENDRPFMDTDESSDDDLMMPLARKRKKADE
ncbi:hypothetical protein KR093_009452, partial [Drosophila rubida]